MATKEIIELGSSDEEAEPPPKKRKPVPNAMVHIPTILPGISIKPAKKNNLTKVIPCPTPSNKRNNQKVILAQSTQISKHVVNPLVDVLKNKLVTLKRPGDSVYLKNPLKVNEQHVKKASQLGSTSSKLNTSGVQVKKVQQQGVQKRGLPNGLSILSKLPPSIKITKSWSMKPNISVIPQHKMRNKARPIANTQIPTVNLDDEEASDQQPPTSKTNWYMKPEQSHKVDLNTEDNNSKKVNFEEQNNKEPESTKYIEITIEDSPIKPVEIGRELPVTIEDSPCKNSINEGNSKYRTEKKEAHSRKELRYPNEPGTGTVQQVVEIEFDPIDISNPNIISQNHENQKNNCEKENSKDQHQGTLEINSERKLESAQDYKEEESQPEFHTVYQKFIDTCFEIENSDDMKKIVEKKIKTYYRQSPKEYVESEEFLDMVSSKILSIKTQPENMYLYIKDIVDELNMQRKTAKSQEAKIPEGVRSTTEVPNESFDVKDDGEYNTKKSKQIRKLEKTIKKLHRAIQKLEEQEVDLEDEENSMYLLTERYKERLVRVHAKFRQMTNTKMPSEPRIVIEARPGCPQGPAKKLEKFINKKVPIGAPLPFPDFHDVLSCVRDANVEDGLGWSNMQIEAEARDLFERCGKKLKRRRQENEWRISVASRMTDTQERDPAEENNDLKQKLCENKRIASKRESEVFNKYVDRQHQLKLEAEEIEEKEAEESLEESEEEELADSHLANKENRKQLLKRIIKGNNSKSVAKNSDAPLDNSETSNQNENTDDKSSTVDKDCANENNVLSESQKVLEPSNDDGDSNNNDDKETESNVIDIDSDDDDELHLLQKLRFQDEVESSCDSDSTIAISDSAESESDGENDKHVDNDVISIENSSYSESEALPEEDGALSNVALEKNKTKPLAVTDLANVSTDNSNNDAIVTNDQDNTLLESSEEDATSENDLTLKESGTCENITDDVLSLTDTLIEGDDKSDTDNNKEDKTDDLEKNELSSTDKDIVPKESPSSKSDVVEPKEKCDQVILDNVTSDIDSNNIKENNTHIEIRDSQE